MSKNIALFFDGTWDHPHDRRDRMHRGAHEDRDDREEDGEDDGANTNVRKLYLAARENDRQATHYLRGVGTRGPIDRVVGGAGGYGVSRNIRDAYEYLVRTFEWGDRIFLFGFSRGAYTARSLAGFLGAVGLLFASNVDDVPAAFALYKRQTDPRQSALWPVLLQLGGRDVNEVAAVPVYLIGAWDTVGRLGVPDPAGIIPDAVVRFHRTDLPANVTHARHALALHELRRQFEPVLWTQYDPRVQTLRQVWFSGAHADVGGGHQDSRLADIALRWMAEEARAPAGAGAPGLELDDALLPAPPHDVRAPVQHGLRKWFALAPARSRRTLSQWPLEVVETMAVAAPAVERLIDPARAPHEVWRRRAVRTLDHIDTLALQLDLRLRYRTTPAAAGRPWWRRLVPADVAEVVARATTVAGQGAFADGPATPLSLGGGLRLGPALCIVLLYGGAPLVRALVAACDERFSAAQRALGAETDLQRRAGEAGQWKQRVAELESAIREADALVPVEAREQLAGAVWPDGDGIGARTALALLLDRLAGRSPVRFRAP